MISRLFEVLYKGDRDSRKISMHTLEPLIDYLLNKYPEVTYEELIGHDEFDMHLHSFSEFLHSVYVREQHSSGANFLKIDPELESLSYTEYIDIILKRLFFRGLRVKRVDQLQNWTSRESSYQISFQVHFLKGENWAKLCNRIGRPRFTQLITSVLWYCKDLGALSRMAGARERDRDPTEKVSKRGMYYYWKSWERAPSFFSESPEQLILTILRSQREMKSRLPRNTRGLRKVLSIAKEQDSQLNYHKIFDLTVESRISINVFENTSSFKDVLRFVLSCLGKVFPDPTFGNQENKCKLNSGVRSYLSSNRSEYFNVRTFVYLLDLPSIRWLGKSRAITSIQDRNLRRKLLHAFFKWLFGILIPTIVKSFWYVTEISPEKSSHSSSAFFPHKSWKSLTKLWMENYVKKYLQEVGSKRNGSPKYFNHGFLRLIPKNSDFRPLCVPSDYLKNKDTRSSYYDAYKAYDWNVIRPIRDILRTQQSKFQQTTCPRNHSVRDIFLHISRFKQSLEINGEGLPCLYGVKFDMKHCYDNLNQSKIIEIIEDLFSEEEFLEEYYVRKVNKQKVPYSLHSHMSLIVKRRSQIAELNIFASHSFQDTPRTVLFDSNKTWKFSKGQILDIVKQQVLNSTIELPGNQSLIFKRRRGIFQGNPLLATFCDIVYTELANKLQVSASSSLETILLRLADDFLFLSTEKSDCTKMLNVATSSLTLDYGAYINNEKCSFLDSQQDDKFDFVGLEIELKNLNVRRGRLSCFKLPSRTNGSFDRVLSYLEWNFGVRLGNYLLDLNFTTPRAILDNVRDVLEPTLDIIRKNLPSDMNESLESFVKLTNFFLSVFANLMKRIEKINGDGLSVSELLDLFQDVLYIKLASQQSNVKNLTTLFSSYISR